MYRPTHPDNPRAGQPAEASPRRTTGPPLADGCGVYDRSYWLAYAANTLLMTSVSLLYRYGDFVSLLGGNELQLGWIVGIGTIGGLAMRLAQGASIVHYGPRKVWIFSLTLMIVSLLAHLLITRSDGPAIYLVRILFNTSLAGAFGCSITYISLRAPVERMAELIGTIGTSGFVGMVLGTQLGDLLCGAAVIARADIDRLFVVAAFLAACSLACVWMATHGELRPVVRPRPPVLWLIRRYHPGRLLLMAMMMGIGIGLPGTFLRPYAAELGIAKIGMFFGVYAVTAFALRIATRRLPAQIGIGPTILLGMTSLAVSMLLQLLVASTWQLIIPAVAAGVAHALLFPAMMAGGGMSFPVRYRGLAITLTLAMFDIGNLVGMPLAGSIIYYSEAEGLPGYPVMFISIAAMLSAASVYYALGMRRPAESPQREFVAEVPDEPETLEIVP